MSSLKNVKIATLKLENKQLNVYGYRNEEALIFPKDYDEVKTERLIQKLQDDIRNIDKKLRIKGYFFSDDIGYYNVVPEVIKELLNIHFKKTIACGINTKDISKAIFYDKSCKGINGIEFNPNDKFDEHFY